MSKFIVQHRRGTLAEWTETEELPREGELVIELDKENNVHKLKIGDGQHEYEDLFYLQAGDVDVTQILTKAKPRVVLVELPLDGWVLGDDDRYGQELYLDDITENSRLDLQPDLDMIKELEALGIVFVTENKGGVITVYSTGNKPEKAYSMQASIVEVKVECELPAIVGAPIGVPAQTAVDPDHTLQDAKDYTDEKIAEIDSHIGEAVSDVSEHVDTLQETVDGFATDVDDLHARIDETNTKTIDKITSIDTYYNDVLDISADDFGITWNDMFGVAYGDNEQTGIIYHKIPLVAGENMRFDVDEDIVRISCNVDFSGYAEKTYVDGLIGDISDALDELHTYAQSLINGGSEQ